MVRNFGISQVLANNLFHLSSLMKISFLFQHYGQVEDVEFDDAIPAAVVNMKTRGGAEQVGI